MESTEQKSGFDETEHGKLIDSGICGEETDDVNYKLYEDGMLHIYGNGEIKKAVFNGDDGVYRNVYQYAKDIKTVYVETGITSISDSAFYHCENLKKVTLPEEMESIGKYAFAYCYSLKEINLPVVLKQISSSMFFDCDSLIEIIIPEGVETIEEMAFSCSGLQSVKLPSTLKKIGKDSFHLTYIEEIEIPENTELIEEGAFAYCSKLRKIKILGAETYIAKKAFESTNNYTIYCTENSEAEKFATENNISYKRLEEYDNIEISNTFNACKSSPCSISISCSENDEFTFLFADGKAVNSMYSGDIKSSFLGIVSYKKIYDLIFDNAGEYIVSVCKNGTIMENVKIIVAENHIYGNGVVSEKATCEKEGILKYTCENCGNYYTEKIPAIGHKYKKTIVTEATCEKEGILKYTCENCGNYYTEKIPVIETTPTTPGTTTPSTPSTTPTTETPAQTNVPAIKGTSLIAEKAKVKVTSDNTANPTVEYLASTDISAKEVTVPDSVTVSGITYKVTSVKDKAFKENKKVTSVTIGKNVISIGKDAFKSCAKLKTVKVESDKLTKIGDGAFNGDKKLTKITLGKGVTSIGKEAFKNCISLKSVTVKSTKLKTIGANAFYGDKMLTTITLKTTKLTKKSVGKNALKGTNKKLKVKVPKKQVKNYKKYFKEKGNKSVKVTK